MDIDETAAAATSLLGDEQLPSNVVLTMEQLQPQLQSHQQQQSQHLMQQQSEQLQHQQRQLQMPQINTNNQQQSQKILQHRLQQQQQQNYINQQNSMQPNQQHQQFHMVSNQQQQQHQQFPTHQHQQQPLASSSKSASTNTSMSNSVQAHPPTQPKQFLINPLTGELEPSLSDDSETEAEQETIQLRNSAANNTSNATNTSHGGTSIYELVHNSSSHFSEDSNSNSCSTAISKLSVGEQNNGGSSTPQLLGTGSDTERSRDSLVSNKSQKNRKSKANLSSTSSLNINTNLATNKHGDMGSLEIKLIISIGSSNADRWKCFKQEVQNKFAERKLQQGLKGKRAKIQAMSVLLNQKRKSKSRHKPQQQSIQQMQQQINQQQTSMNPPQYQQQESIFPHSSSTSLTERSNVSPVNTTPSSNSSTPADEPRIVTLNANKTKSQLKRSHPIVDNTNANSSTSGNVTLDDQTGMEAKQSKLTDNVIKIH
ncbi:hypothetical protein EVAR_101435_1 [Eumeta japonica]|uniref:Uncharacterized protein n=1 Tax=Eumeta variegata TaxID=151549 RepID=A0A4C1TRY9_EUMVA|nr:hypothetical protein EVAR_101435_1 [Eumeta japonica]